ncbi:hypothetical protein GO988_19760 [Hymenobacter sp. HMF4947]|uniref:Outer membrane protein beta-barrel domain-containing protein n=1 Tax=Hymenobacter ginkgonis TaxID=2682976 RepID=A0A7K1TJJ9_9BACT|nr:hypothetical protein [Hymenobacter ginkgonis]MVN78574.1 hypothetical protein [Hymenobacter ginkgonis]
MKSFYVAVRLLLPLSALLTSCAVYVPTVPCTPLLRSKSEVEITAALRLSSLEADVAWSPAPHVLLAGEMALQRTGGQDSRNGPTGPVVTADYSGHHFQGGVGLGTYWLLGERQQFYLGALSGVGVAKADLYDQTGEFFAIILPIFGPAVPVHYQANYWRYYGQLYAAQQASPKVTYGFSFRTTVVNYREVLRDGQPVSYSPAQVFYEPHAFLRYGQGVVQGVTTFGYSFPGTPSLEAEQLLTPTTWLISLGIVFRPTSLRHKN